MSRKRRFPIVLAYVLSLLVTIALLVGWVIWVVATVEVVRAVAGRVGVAGENAQWVALAVGCALLFALIAGLTWQLAQALAARRYSLKQEEFLSNVTHELRSPLAAIKLHAQTLLQDVSPQQQRRSLELVLQQADRMGRLVDDVLESSRLVSRPGSTALIPIDVSRFFADYLPAAAARIEAQHLHLVWTLESAATVLASPDALDRVMDNLLDNAARFSYRGGEVRCQVSDQPGGVVRIEVEDDGVGVPRSDLARIFDRFYQAGNERDGRRRGTGLGLSIVAGLVQEMKGQVRAVSPEGRPGSRFIVELPASGGAAG